MNIKECETTATSILNHRKAKWVLCSTLADCCASASSGASRALKVALGPHISPSLEKKKSTKQIIPVVAKSTCEIEIVFTHSVHWQCRTHLISLSVTAAVLLCSSGGHIRHSSTNYPLQPMRLDFAILLWGVCGLMHNHNPPWCDKCHGRAFKTSKGCSWWHGC